jgi:hypothetical protein
MTADNQSESQLTWTHVGIAVLIAIIAGAIVFYTGHAGLGGDAARSWRTDFHRMSKHLRQPLAQLAHLTQSLNLSAFSRDFWLQMAEFEIGTGPVW